MNALHRLVYYSRNRIVGRDELGRHLSVILAASQRNNAPIGVTGALMFNAGCFCQVLEGGRQALESTFERIQQDPRHGDVTVLAFAPAAERLFGHWSMGFVGARALDAAAFSDIADLSGFDPARASGEEMIEVLKRLAMEEEGVGAL